MEEHLIHILKKLLVGDNTNLKSMTCYDPAAGTGTLVIALAHAIGEQKCSVYTQDISDKSSTMMMLNLILNGMSHSLTNVIKGNTLLHPFHKDGEKLKQFDYVVSNPPFGGDFSDYQKCKTLMDILISVIKVIPPGGKTH